MFIKEQLFGRTIVVRYLFRDVTQFRPVVRFDPDPVYTTIFSYSLGKIGFRSLRLGFGHWGWDKKCPKWKWD